MRAFLVVNPHSANGLTGRRWPELGALAARALGSFSHAFTERPLHAQELAKRAQGEGYDCVVAVGGDGTINEVVNGLMSEGGRPEAALGVIPRGTGGDFRRTFGWGDGQAPGFHWLGEAQRRTLDVGRLDYVTREGEPKARFFVNVCSFGASGQIVDTVNRGARVLGGRAGFLWATAKSLSRYRDQRVRLSLDDRPWEETDVTTVAVANGRYFGGGMCVAPTADASDGIFDVTVWSGYSLFDMVVKAPTLYSGSHVRLAGTRTLRCRSLRAESDQDVLIDCDGEAPGRLPVRITVVPSALRLIG